MDINEIKVLIHQGESNTLEFKTSTAALKGAMETLCAFLNQKGGIVLIGVNGRKELVGQDVTDNTRQEIANELNKIEPPAQIDVAYVPFQSKQIIVLKTVAGNHAPYVYDGRPFRREQSSTSKMPQQRYDQLVARRFQHNFSWEKLEAEGYGIDDLDKDLILGAVRKAVEIKRMPEEALRQELPQLLKSLQLLANDPINNAAVALFARKITANYLQCQLKVARFKGMDRHEFLDSDLIYGNVFELLEHGMLFVKRHLPIAAYIEPGKLERVETPLIPFNAVREGLINALCHKDYSRRGGSIGLAIYDDRMEIFNDGGLPAGVTLEEVKLGFSSPRNPIIADLLYRCNLIEKWGRGIPNIISSCKAANDPEPKFFSDNVQFKVLFEFPTSLKPAVLVNTPEEKGTTRMTERQREILNILMSVGRAIKTKELMEKFRSTPLSERTLRNDLAALRKQGRVKSSGRGRNALWYGSKKQ